MPNIAIYDGFEFGDNDGSVMQDGSLDTPLLVTAEDPPAKYTNTVNLTALTGKAILWDAANGPDDFNFLRIKSDTGDSANGWVMVELQTDETNAIGRQVFTIALAAGIPLQLCSSASYANYTLNFGGGTLSQIQKVTVQNLNTADANVSIWLVD